MSISMKKNTIKNAIKNIIIFLLSLGCFVVLWDRIAGFYDPKLFPKSGRILTDLINVVLLPNTYSHLWASFGLVLQAFLLSILIALPTALLCFNYRLFSKIILPYHEFIRYIPVPALVPFCAAILGVGDSTKIVLVFIGTYFQMLFLFISNLESITKGFFDTAKTLGIKGIDLTRKITLRAAAPDLLDSIRVTFAWSWSYLLVAEVVNSNKGIGYAVMQSYRALNMPRLISYILIIGIFGIIMDWLLKTVRSKLCPYIKYSSSQH